MLARTGWKAALAAEIVSLWICIKVPFFDLRSTVIGTGGPGADKFAAESIGGAAVFDDAEGGFDDEPSDVIRSMSVVPDDSWKAETNIIYKTMQRAEGNR